MKRKDVLFTTIVLFLGLMSFPLPTAADNSIISGSGGNSPAAVNNVYRPSNTSTFNPMFGRDGYPGHCYLVRQRQRWDSMPCSFEDEIADRAAGIEPGTEYRR